MRSLFLLLLLSPALASAAEVYRWVDDDGTVHYSDRPREGAETIVIQEAQTFSAPVPRSTRRGAAESAPAAPAEAEDVSVYSRFAIVSPQQEEVLWNTGGELNVSWQLNPRLQSGHSMLLFLDGQQVRQLRRGVTQTQLTDVFRGTHSLHAEVRDRGGATLARTDAVRFTVQQTSIQNPNNPNRPALP